MACVCSNPQHRWVHISGQTRDEVLVYAGCDSGWMGAFIFLMLVSYK